MREWARLVKLLTTLEQWGYNKAEMLETIIYGAESLEQAIEWAEEELEQAKNNGEIELIKRKR